MITIVPYNPEWPARYQIIVAPIESALKERVLTMHHIGSTSVPGLAAKDIIDIQVTVAKLDRDIIPIM